MGGGSVRLSFRTVHGKRISGVGKAVAVLACKGTLVGTLSGPGGNRGVWEFVYIPADSFYHEYCDGRINVNVNANLAGANYDCDKRSFVVIT